MQPPIHVPSVSEDRFYFYSYNPFDGRCGVCSAKSAPPGPLDSPPLISFKKTIPPSQEKSGPTFPHFTEALRYVQSQRLFLTTRFRSPVPSLQEPSLSKPQLHPSQSLPTASGFHVRRCPESAPLVASHFFPTDCASADCIPASGSLSGGFPPDYVPADAADCVSAGRVPAGFTHPNCASDCAAPDSRVRFPFCLPDGTQQSDARRRPLTAERRALGVSTAPSSRIAMLHRRSRSVARKATVFLNGISHGLFIV
ncbi:hypothetical protein PAPYR_463 [Paratrimastix pyriformis]|uniref:Uncharacterized protein n=1 Tax=Paratrimastix pyriformis TaxID=342808 RepID=A0ABQ8V018_9EUKA|nr:hypothetical protein PAPYR_463 [Paratrimastix pyriformis]